MLDVRNDFPIFKQTVHGNPLVYLDSAATSQKPQVVLDSLNEYYTTYNANVRRGIYPLAEKATARVEETRAKVAKFLHAKHKEEIIFVRNTTEALNLIAYSFASHNINSTTSVVATIMEHHSNFVPWQQIALQKGSRFAVLDISASGLLILDNEIVKQAGVVALTHVSNMLGTINPVKKIIAQIKKLNPRAAVVVDAAQSVPNMPVDVQDLGCDFLAFSGHKTFAGTGVGVLYGKKELLEKMAPFLYGGAMIKEVGVEKTTFASPPFKFEAGTPAIADIISLGVAISYLENIGMGNVRQHEAELVTYALSQMEELKNITIYGPKNAQNRGGVISFTMENIHPHDIAQVLGDMGICIRAGHHCTMPLHKRLGIPASARASFSIYNTKEDVDAFMYALKKVQQTFKL